MSSRFRSIRLRGAQDDETDEYVVHVIVIVLLHRTVRIGERGWVGGGGAVLARENRKNGKIINIDVYGTEENNNIYLYPKNEEIAVHYK